MVNFNNNIPIRPLTTKARKKGRPRIIREKIDKGTVELQQKRQLLLKNLTNSKSVTIDQRQSDVTWAVFDGCYLHKLFYQNYISKHQLEIGLKLKYIYTLCMRSKGIKNRIRGTFMGINSRQSAPSDTFEKQGIERAWDAITNKIRSYVNNTAVSQAILDIILSDSLKNNPYQIPLFKKNLIESLKMVLDECYPLLGH